MNKKDKKEFDKWWLNRFHTDPPLSTSTFSKDILDAWEDACTYKQEEIENLKKEIQKLTKQVSNLTDISFWSGKAFDDLLDKNKIMQEALELIAGDQEFYCEVGDRNKQYLARATLAKYKS